MKKTLFFIGATLLIASLSLVGCKKDAEQPSTTTAEEVKISEVKDSGASESVSMLKDDNISNDEIMNLISTAVTNETAMETISNKFSEIFTDNSASANVVSSAFRAATTSDLETAFESISKKFTDFVTDISTNGSGSVSYSKEFGEITDLDNTGFLTLSIPKVDFSLNASQSLSGTRQSYSGNGNVVASAKASLDFSKIEGIDDFAVKYAIASVAVDGNGNINAISEATYDESTGATAIPYLPSFSGNISATATANSGTSLVIPYTKEGKTYSLGGKLIETATVKVNCSDLSKIDLQNCCDKITDETGETMGVYLNIYKLLDALKTTVNISATLYTDDGTEVAKLVSISSVDELKAFIEKYSSDAE